MIEFHDTSGYLYEMCDSCADKKLACCDDCGEWWVTEKMTRYKDDDLCPDCYEKALKEDSNEAND